jgi:hypothetical protein
LPWFTINGIQDGSVAKMAVDHRILADREHGRILCAAPTGKLPARGRASGQGDSLMSLIRNQGKPGAKLPAAAPRSWQGVERTFSLTTLQRSVSKL